MTLGLLGQTIYVLLSPLLYLSLGVALASALYWWQARRVPELSDGIFSRPAALLALGLLAHLLALLLLKILSCSWLLAVVISHLPALFFVRKTWRLLSRVRLRAGFNFVLWLFVGLCLGTSLFQAVGGIETPWVNNYGDLTFHLGMISSFVFFDKFPPEYHIFAGESLSYPFLINLWSASYWWLSSGWRELSFIFMFQWVLIWLLVYPLFNGSRYPLLPWALLLGGGTYSFLATGSLSAWVAGNFDYSWELLSKGYPWTVFLTTIWVTQRGAALGLLAAGAALVLVYQGLRQEPNNDSRRALLMAGGAVVGLSVLAHSHFWLLSLMFLGLVLLVPTVQNWWQRRRLSQSPDPESGPNLLAFIDGALISLPLLWFVMGKASMLNLQAGWLVGEGLGGPEHRIIRKLVAGKAEDLSVMEIIGKLLSEFGESALMWLGNAPFFLLLFGLYWVLSRRQVECVILLGLFILGNLLSFSYWEWDQLKYFLALYCILLGLWSLEERPVFRWAHGLMLLLIIPALMEVYKVFKEGPAHTVYDREVLAAADEIRSHLPREAVVAAAPLHNSPVTLSGRRLFYGYNGTIWSHGLDRDGQRYKLQQSLADMAACPSDKICPGYLLWDHSAERLWGRLDLNLVQPLPGSASLYRFKRQAEREEADDRDT